MSEDEKPLKLVMPEPKGPVADVWTDGRFDDVKAAGLYEATKSWPPDKRSAMLRSLRAAEVRATVKTKYRSPADIAAAVDQRYVRTPAINIIATALEAVLTAPRPLNVLITMPPQEGKSQLCSVWTPMRALQIDPNQRIILATYAQPLADTHSRSIRGLIDQHGTGVTDSLTGLPVEDKLGLRLAKGDNSVNSWSIEGTGGGFVAAGLGATITGRRADLMIIDDPFKNKMEADSAAHRVKVADWFSTVALTRLSPAASIILVQTRWHPEDLAGKILTGERALDKGERTWRHINIPAISEVGIPDALGREPGVPMVSARDTVDEDGNEIKRDFPATRKRVGERTWYALYQGSPRNPAGGIFQRAWFDPRLPGPPDYPVCSIVGVDPADSGEGDEAGIIGGSLLPNGVVALTHDRSGQFTSDQWARAAVMLALEMGAIEIGVEGYTTSKTYIHVVQRAYREIHIEVVKKKLAGTPLTLIEQRAIPDIPPFTIHPWRGANKADAVARAGGMSQSFEVGKCRTVEFALAVFEEQAADWQAGQHQPDRVAAAIIVHDKLMEKAGQQTHIASPVNRKVAPPPAWMRRKI